MGKATKKKIGASVGEVKAVDVHDDDPGWGEYLRVKIRLDLSKPLSRDRMLHVQNLSIWIAFKYEKLPNYCYQCGVIMHGQKGCDREGSWRSPSTKADQPYGPWLRVIFPLRRIAPCPRRERTCKADVRTRKSFQPPVYYAERRYTKEDPKGGGTAVHRSRNPNSRVDSANMETGCNSCEEVNEEDVFHLGNVEMTTNLFSLRQDMRGLNPLGDCNA